MPSTLDYKDILLEDLKKNPKLLYQYFEKTMLNLQIETSVALSSLENIKNVLEDFSKDKKEEKDDFLYSSDALAKASHFRDSTRGETKAHYHEALLKHIEHIENLAATRVKNETSNKGAILPDGSGCFVQSMGLPPDHWVFQDKQDLPKPCISTEFGEEAWFDALIKAGRWAVKVSTHYGKEKDLDFDALVCNFIIALTGKLPPKYGYIGYLTDSQVAILEGKKCGLAEEDPRPSMMIIKN